MANIESQALESIGTKRKVHREPRIDMTPMVDLGFLLITFFIFTTTLSDKTTIKLYMPHEGDPTPTGESRVLTVLLGNNNKVYAYEGGFEKAVKEHKVVSTSYDEAGGIGQLIREKQMQLMGTRDGKASLLFLIKPTKQSTYKNVVDALDETTINGVKKYMLVEPSVQENQFFKE
ncbi:MAG: ExbD/TolR family protein [Flavisolibacter sp.]